MLRHHNLVGGIPTPLKNIKVSWDDDILQYIESHEKSMVILKIAIEIVDFPIKNGGSFHSYVKLPEGNPQKRFVASSPRLVPSHHPRPLT